MRYSFSFLIVIVVISALFLLESCKVGPDFKTQRTEIDATAVYRHDSQQLEVADAVLNLRWWELFNDPIIDTLITIGLKENKDVLIATSRIEQARAQLGFTKAELWPSVTYQAGVSSGNVFQGLPSDDISNLFTGFGSVSWEIDFWGKFRRSNEAARAELLATEFGQRSVQIGLISAISGTYYQLLDYRWRQQISINTLSLRDQTLEIIQARYDEGIIPEIDLNQAQIQRAIAASSVPLFQRMVAQTENALSILLGRNPGPILTMSELQQQTLPPDIPVGLPSMLMVRRPDVLQAEALLHAQTARIGVAVAQQFPSISLTGLLGVASSDISTLTANGPAFNIGASLLGPLFEFGKNKRRVEIERKRTEQVVYEYERTVINAFKDVEDALVEINTLKEELKARQEHVRAAQNAQRLSAERYNKGVTSYLELIESQTQAFQAELRLSETTQQLFNGYVKLYKALGGGWLSDDEMTSAATNWDAAEQK